MGLSALFIFFLLGFTMEKLVDLNLSEGESAQMFPKIFKVNKDVFLLLGCYYFNKNRENRGRLIVLRKKQKIIDVKIPSPIYYGFSPINDTLIVVGDRECNIYLYNISGRLLKRKSLEGPPIYDVRVNENVIFYQKYQISVLSNEDLKVIRKLEFHPSTYSDALVYRIFNNKLYIQQGRNGNFLLCCSLSNTNAFWKVDLGMKNFVILGLLPAPRIISSIDFIGNNLYAGTMIGDMIVMKSEGKILHSASVARGLIIKAIRELSHEILLVDTYEGILFGIDKKTMQRVWEFKMEGQSGEPSLVLKVAGLILPVDAKGNIYILDFNGRLREKIKIDDTFDNAGYLLAGDVDEDRMIELVLKGSLKGRIYMVDTEFPCRRNEIIRGDRND